MPASIIIKFNHYEELLEKIEKFKILIRERDLEHIARCEEIGGVGGLMDPLGIWIDIGGIDDTEELVKRIKETKEKTNKKLSELQITLIDEKE